MDRFSFKVNVTWTSPYFVYTPQDQWDSGVTTQSDSVAVFNFRANAIKLFGRANATYSTQLDEAASQPANPRRFNSTSGEIPSNVSCDETTPGGCTVIAENYNLDPSVDHAFKLQSKFDPGSNQDIGILVMQVIHETSFGNRTVQQLSDVTMEDSRITYAGTWQNIAYNAGTVNYRISSTPGSTITFPFNGYGIYVWGTTDLFTSKVSVSLDGQTYNMPAPSSKYPDPYCLLWYQAGLDQNNQHTVVVTNTETTGLVIRGFTVIRLIDPLNPGQSVPPTTQSSIQPNPASTTPSSQNSSQTSTQDSTKRLSTGVTAGIAIGVVLGFVLAVAAFFLHRRMRRKRVQSEKDAHPSAPFAQTLMGVPTPRSSKFGQVTPWEGPITPGSGNGTLQTPPALTPYYPPPRVEETASLSSASGRKAVPAFGVASPNAGSSRDGGSTRHLVPTNAQSPTSPGFSPSGYQYQQPGVGFYGMEYHKPPLDLGGSSSTPSMERERVVQAVAVAPSSSSGYGHGGSERGASSAVGSPGTMLSSETALTVSHTERSATPPPAYEYRAQQGTSSNAREQQREEQRRREEERQRQRDEKSDSGSGLG